MGALLINENRIGVTVLSNHFDGGSGFRTDYMSVNENYTTDLFSETLLNSCSILD